MCREMEQIYNEGMESGEKLGFMRGEKLGLERGRSEGEKIGAERGKREGEREKEIFLAMRMKEKGVAYEEIADILGVTIEQLRNILSLGRVSEK